VTTLEYGIDQAEALVVIFVVAFLAGNLLLARINRRG
jgi:hypothetical protein